MGRQILQPEQKTSEPPPSSPARDHCEMWNKNSSPDYLHGHASKFAHERGHSLRRVLVLYQVRAPQSSNEAAQQRSPAFFGRFPGAHGVTDVRPLICDDKLVCPFCLSVGASAFPALTLMSPRLF
eukprot:5845328-Amphidinium_carterae.1